MYLGIISIEQDTGAFFFLRTFSYIPTVPQITAFVKMRTRRLWSTLTYMLTVSSIGNTLLHLLN
jgi:hypothetical protein